MSILIDSGDVHPADRKTAVHEAIAKEFVSLEIGFPGIEQPTVRSLISDIGDLRVCSISSNIVQARRSAGLARDDLEPSVFLGVQTSGSCVVEQHGREAVLRPGRLVLFESTAPFSLVDGAGITQVKIRIPMDRLALPREMITRATAVALSPDHPVADLAAAYFQRMATQPERFSEPAAASVSQPSIELVRALITTHLDLTGVAAESMQATLRLRILEYVRANLHDANLSAARIAAEHYISVRHLYQVLADGQVSLGSWIRTQRLEGCRADLARPELQMLSIAALARRWGFADASTFGRIFRSAYGVSPREYRRGGAAVSD